MALAMSKPVPAAGLEDLLERSLRDDDAPRAWLFAGFDRWIASALVHPQDAFVVRHLLRLMAIAAFAAWAQFHLAWWSTTAVYVAIVLNGETIGRFLHILSHRKLFRSRFAGLNTALTWIVSPWIGEPPCLFASEHVANHHAQDNGLEDLGCTRPYQRDSWAGLGRYLLDFFVGGSGAFGLARLFGRRRGGRVWRRRFYLGQAIFWSLVLTRLRFDWVAAVTLLIVPYLFVQAFNRANNWTEHAFINPERPDDPLGNAYTIVDSRFNTGVGYNEGYHAAHHLRPGLPNHLWPKAFRDRVEDYQAADHLVFQGTGANDIFFMLMFKDYKGLAKHYVPWPDRPRSEAEVIDLLRQRVARQV